LGRRFERGVQIWVSFWSLREKGRVKRFYRDLRKVEKMEVPINP